MASLVERSINKQDPLSSIQGYEPERIEMDEATDTVEGRLQSIIDKNSKRQRGEAARADMEMNRRGLVDSAMGLKAAEAARIESALPIASQDAAASLQVKGSNQMAGNQAGQFNASQLNTASLAERDWMGRSDLSAQEDQQQQDRMSLADRIQRGQMGLGHELEKKRMGYANELEWGMRDNLHAKEKELRQIDQGYGLDTLERQQEYQKELDAIRQGYTLEQQREAFEQDLARNAELSDQRIQLQQINRNYDVLLQTSQGAAMYYSQHALGVAEILSNPELTQAEKTGLVRQQMNLLESGLAVLGGIGNMDLAGLLDFRGDGTPPLYGGGTLLGDGTTPPMGMPETLTIGGRELRWNNEMGRYDYVGEGGEQPGGDQPGTGEEQFGTKPPDVTPDEWRALVGGLVRFSQHEWNTPQGPKSGQWILEQVKEYGTGSYWHDWIGEAMRSGATPIGGWNDQQGGGQQPPPAAPPGAPVQPAPGTPEQPPTGPQQPGGGVTVSQNANGQWQASDGAGFYGRENTGDVPAQPDPNVPDRNLGGVAARWNPNAGANGMWREIPPSLANTYRPA